jgi:hypothetical protein
MKKEPESVISGLSAISGLGRRRRPWVAFGRWAAVHDILGESRRSPAGFDPAIQLSNRLGVAHHNRRRFIATMR